MEEDGLAQCPWEMVKCPLWLPPGREWQCWGKTSRSVEKIAFRRVSIHGKEDCPNCVNLLDVFSTFPSKVSLQFQLEVQENWSVVYLARGYGKILPTCQSFPEATITILTPNICSATFFFWMSVLCLRHLSVCCVMKFWVLVCQRDKMNWGLCECTSMHDTEAQMCVLGASIL